VLEGTLLAAAALDGGVAWRVAVSAMASAQDTIFFMMFAPGRFNGSALITPQIADAGIFY
jgi:hypothetical protein